jgi:hypothetical protein
MRNAGRIKLGFYPLPPPEAQRLRAHVRFPAEPFTALDPCVGDGEAFQTIVRDSTALRYGIELDAYRTEQARKLGISVLQGDTIEVECRVDSLSFLYLNPPYDFEVGKTGNDRMEAVFLRHTGRWLMPGGVLILVIPQRQLSRCARTLADHFEETQVYRLTDPESIKFNQVAVLAVRRHRHNRLRDEALEAQVQQFNILSEQPSLPPLTDVPGLSYPVPPSPPASFIYRGLAFDEVEDKLLESAAYRQVKRIILREHGMVRGRPLTPLHGGHVGLLCTAGMLNGVFGAGELRHVANWQSRKYTEIWQEEGDASNVRHTREYFSHECALLWINGATKVLTHKTDEKESDDPDDSAAELTEQRQDAPASPLQKSNVVVMPMRADAPRTNGSIEP